MVPDQILTPPSAVEPTDEDRARLLAAWGRPITIDFPVTLNTASPEQRAYAVAHLHQTGLDELVATLPILAALVERGGGDGPVWKRMLPWHELAVATPIAVVEEEEPAERPDVKRRRLAAVRKQPFTHNGVTLLIHEWALKQNLVLRTVFVRIRNGWPVAAALEFEPRVRVVEPPREEDPTKPSRDAIRSRREHKVRAKTISMKRSSKSSQRVGLALYPEQPGIDYHRPVKRADCIDGVRPCPFVSCSANLYLDVSPKTGAIKVNFPDLEPDEMVESCALDVAERGGLSLKETGGAMNLTRERTRQVEVASAAVLEQIAELRERAGLEGRPMKRNVIEEDERDEEADDGDGDGETEDAVDMSITEEFDPDFMLYR